MRLYRLSRPNLLPILYTLMIPRPFWRKQGRREEARRLLLLRLVMPSNIRSIIVETLTE